MLGLARLVRATKSAGSLGFKNSLCAYPGYAGYFSRYQSCLKGNGIVAIRREDKNRWERRAPLAPSHVATLVNRGVKVLLQPSTLRIFSDAEYEEAGAIIQEDLSPASVIFGVKEIPIHKLLPERTYCFFSHTIKAQAYNMPLLDAILEKNIRLLDYERIVDTDGNRLVKFGKFAGYAGMIDFLHGLGNRFLALGYSTPLLNVGYMHMYIGLDSARSAIVEMGKTIAKQGLPPALCPLVFVFTGTGSVSHGAQEIFNLLPHKWVKPSDLPGLMTKHEKNIVYGCIASSDHIVAPIDPSTPFSRRNYYENPQLYDSIFAEKFGPYASVIVNSMYWDPTYPRILTTEQMEELNRTGRGRLIGVADLSCDLEGSIEFMRQLSSIDHPLYLYDIATRKISYDLDKGKGILFLAVDNLPSEIPTDATIYFSGALLPFVEALAFSDASVPIEQQNDLPSSLKNAIITSQGKLTPSYEYISELRKTRKQPNLRKRHSILVLGSGMVAQPFVNFFAKSFNNQITIASNNLEQVTKLAEGKPNVETFLLDIADETSLDQLIKSHDIVVSLLPAPLHPRVANVCIEFRKHLVTTSYISDEMKSLDERAQAAGITILNEIGLDPGLDHISAMKIIEDVKNRGGQILSFTSYCGGLPAPEASDNPFGYKFSWYPKGVLMASKAGARFKRGGREMVVPAGQIFSHAKPLNIYPGFALEGYPNRDSLKYAEAYGVADTKTFLRGTLRYQGFSTIVGALNKLGYLNDAPNPRLQPNQPPVTWREITVDLLQDGVTFDISNAVLRKLGFNEPGTEAQAALVNRAFQWLGLYSETVVSPAGSLLDALCLLMQSKLKYEDDERDLVILRHDFVVRWPSGKEENIVSSLVAYGDQTSTAMARTVALPAAVATHLILNDTIIRRGVIAPLTPDIYFPLLTRLQTEGLSMKETISD